MEKGEESFHAVKEIGGRVGNFLSVGLRGELKAKRQQPIAGLEWPCDGDR